MISPDDAAPVLACLSCGAPLHRDRRTVASDSNASSAASALDVEWPCRYCGATNIFGAIKTVFAEDEDERRSAQLNKLLWRAWRGIKAMATYRPFRIIDQFDSAAITAPLHLVSFAWYVFSRLFFLFCMGGALLAMLAYQ